jgi:hypothetical protein
MNLHKYRSALIILSLILCSNAFAIDQVKLKNGTTIEGKVLSDVPNLHVDIELINGNKKRYPHDEVESVERDVPSNKDSHMNGNTSEAYFGAQVGIQMSLDPATPGATTSTSYLSWGARGGVNVAQLDFAKFAIGISFNHVDQTPVVVGGSTISDNRIFAQLLFRKVGDTGFYFGPQFGIDFSNSTNVLVPALSLSGSGLTYGVDMGYDYYFSPSFSMGPDVQYEYTGVITYNASGTVASVAPATSITSNRLLILLTATFHL